MAKLAISTAMRGIGHGSLALSGLLGMASVLIGPAALAAAARFSCGTSNGAPATIARTNDGRSVPMIRWTSNVFDGAGWTPERRCREVSQRFDTYRQQGRLAYVTTGRINGLPVICTAARDGGPCDGLLYTLKPSQDPTMALKQLFEVRYKARGPLNETRTRLYLSIDELLVGRTTESGTAAPTAAPAQAGGETRALW
jgi:hypothetical protein